jgi:tRNA(His) 5'-end guanylyltransferase
MPGKGLADFDCRIYQTPTLNDATLQLLWREQDATRNSILSLAQSMFSHKEIQNINTNRLQDKMMLERGVNWNDLHVRLKRGTYVKRQLVTTPFSKEELETLPEGHNARKNPNLVISRHIVKNIEYPIMSAIGNRVEVIFNDQEPISHKPNGK